MSEVVFEIPFVVTDLRISVGSELDHFDVVLILECKGTEQRLKLLGGLDIEDLTLVFGASRISVEKNTSRGLEFGLYTLCVTNEGCMEFEFNSFEVQHST